MSLDALDAFLAKKRIDHERLKSALPQQYQAWHTSYADLGESAFDQRHKFEFNPLRRRFPLA